MKTTIAVSCVASLLLGCGIEPELGNQSPEFSDTSAALVAEPTLTPATGLFIGQVRVQLAPREVCNSGRQLDFQVRATGLSAWEGRRVMVAAFENAANGTQQTGTRSVLLSGVISNGEFSVACPRALEENYAYPSWAAFIDVDGDGKCTSRDVGAKAQLYGWAYPVNGQLLATDFAVIPAAGGPGHLRAPLGSSATGFCEGFFF